MEYTTTMSAFYTGYDGKLATKNIFCLMQDAITRTFGSMGCDGFTMKEHYNAMWVFTKQKAKVYYRPHWEEAIRIDCKIVFATRLICYVHTKVYDDKDELAVDGVTECCLLDKATFRFVRLNTIPVLKVEEEECDKDFIFDEFEPEDTFKGKVTYSLIDMSMHLNNGLALTPIMDTLTLDEIKEMESHTYEIGIKYSNQAMYDIDFTIGRKKDTNQILFRYDTAEKNLELGYFRW